MVLLAMKNKKTKTIFKITKTVAKRKKKKKKVFQIDVELIAYDKRSFSKTAGMLSGGTCSRTVKSWLPRKPNNSLHYCI